MDQAKIDAVRNYLNAQFPNRHVEHRGDFDLDAQRFKIYVDGGTLLVKVSDLLLDDTAAADLENLLDRMRIGDQLRRLDASTEWLHVSQSGLRRFQRM